MKEEKTTRTMETETTSKNEGVVSLLKTILKRSIEVPHDVLELAKGLKMLADDVKDLSSVVSTMSQVMYQQGIAIKEIYTAQSIIMKKMKGDIESNIFPDIDKNKEEKPN